MQIYFEEKCNFSDPNSSATDDIPLSICKAWLFTTLFSRGFFTEFFLISRFVVVRLSDNWTKVQLWPIFWLLFCDFLLFLLLDENHPLSDNPHRKSALWPVSSRIFWKENCSSDPNILFTKTQKIIDIPWLCKFWKQFSFFTLTFFDWPGSKSIFVKDERSVGSGFAEGKGRGCIAGFSQKCNNGATNHCHACPRITRICLSLSFYLSIFC